MYSLPNAFKGVISNPVAFTNPNEALDYVCKLYSENVDKLRTIAISETDFTNTVSYPYVGIYAKKEKDGLLDGAYGTTISHPEILYDYYKEQFRIIIEEHKIPIWIGLSNYPMSLTFIDEDLFNSLAMKKQICPSDMPCMLRIQRGLKGLHKTNQIKPLSAFHGERTGYSLNRLHHYSGTDPKYFQNTVIFVNYHIYTEFFIEYAKDQIEKGHFEEFIGPGVRCTKESGFEKNRIFDPQMPAYHLVGKNRSGITLVNINVGPSNVKTITDHIAVLRSHRWIMLGHCAGLRQDNKIGDYIIAHNYLRHDYVLDPYVPKQVPIPASNNLMKIFQSTSDKHTGDLNSVFTGTVVTTCDRNWELNSDMVDEFSEAKAIGIDMESATVATNAFRFGVESLAFLCISDMPLHGAPKLRSMASMFYMNKVREHFDICIDAVRTSYTPSALVKDDSMQYSHYKTTSTPFR